MWFVEPGVASTRSHTATEPVSMRVFSFKGGCLLHYLCHSSLAASLHFLHGFADYRLWRAPPSPSTGRNWARSRGGVDLGNGWAACLPFFSHRKKCLEITLGWGLLTGGGAGCLLWSLFRPCWPSAALPYHLPSSRCHQLGRHRSCRCPSRGLVT